MVDSDAAATAPGEQPPPAAVNHDLREGQGFQLLHTLEGHERSVAAVKFSRDGQLLASASADKTIRVWDVVTGELIRCLKQHEKGISDVAWSNQSSDLIASASDDKTLIIWNAKSGSVLKTLTGHTNYVMCCCFSPRDNMLLSGSFDETVRLWDVREGRLLREVPAHSDPITAVDFHGDDNMFVTASFDGLCRVYDTTTGQCLKTLIPPGNPPVTFARFTPNGKFLLTCTLDNKIRLWDFKTGKEKKSYQGHCNTKFCLTAAVDTGGTLHKRPYIICGSEDNSIFAWDVNSKEVVQRIDGRSAKEEAGDGHFAPVLCVGVFSETGLMASGALEGDSSVKIWKYQNHSTPQPTLSL